MISMFLSLGIRAIVNVDALNMVESVGNVTRHRKATIVLRRGSEYIVRIVPVVSGESIAHAYQWWLAELAKQRYSENVPLCEYCEKGEFLKHSDLNLFGSKNWEKNLKGIIEKGDYDVHEVEKIIVENCVVEDIGGFLYPGDKPVKRTSRFQNSYMVPTFDSLEKGAVSVEPQFHVRHSPTRVAKEGEQAAGQAIYYVETASAVYALTFNLDLDGIGRTLMVKIEEAVSEEERKMRKALAIDALAAMLDSKIFGAKLSRFTPIIDYETTIAAISSKPPFVVSAPASPNFAEDTAKRAGKHQEFFGKEVKLLGIGERLPEGVERAENILDLFKRVRELVIP